VRAQSEGSKGVLVLVLFDLSLVREVLSMESVWLLSIEEGNITKLMISDTCATVFVLPIDSLPFLIVR
jgi:hypothetical protein